MEQLIFEVLMRNLEVVNVKDGGGDTTAIAVSNTTYDYPQTTLEVEMSAKKIATEIAEELSIK